MSKCQVCGIELLADEITYQGRTLFLCPLHQILWAVGRLPGIEGAPTPHEPFTCEVTGETGEHVSRFIERRERLGDKDEVWHLRHDILLRLIRKSLTPEEWRALVKTHGQDSFQLHEDFYDDEGNALQPH